MRSLLFVPADSERKLARAMTSDADALILDLEDAIALPAKEVARVQAAAFLRDHPRRARKHPTYVRINGLTTGLADADLDGIVPAAPDGIVLPKAAGGADVTRLSAMLAVREALAGIDDGATRIVAIATETAGALFTLGSYQGASARLVALTWGAEDLSVALGSETARDAEGRLTDPYRLARTLTLAGAAAAGVPAIDTVFVNFRDDEGLAAEAAAAHRDGFAGKLAIHPNQVPIINRVFTPAPEAIARARTIIAAFRDAPESGVVSLDGEMLDRPHLRRAELILARAKASGLG
jgi:citrate lyase subunit beta/citryl-CoA lyase